MTFSRSTEEVYLFYHEEKDLVEDCTAGDLHRRVQLLLLVSQMACQSVGLSKNFQHQPLLKK